MTETLDEDSILEWVWGTIQGDFNENPSVGQLITNAIITAIPVVDQVADVRDLTANLKAMIWDKRYDDFTVWLALFFTLIGLIPTVGSLLKGVLKLVWKGAKLDEVLRFFNKFMKGNGVRWLKELRAGKLKQYSKEAAQMGKDIIDNVSSTIREAMEYIPTWAGNIYQKMQALLSALKIVRSKIDDMFARITSGLEEKLDDLIRQNMDNSAEGSSKSTLMVKQEADEVANKVARVTEPGNKMDKLKSLRTNDDVPPRYREDPRFNDLASDPDHAGAIKPSTRAEAVAGIEAEKSGLIEGPIKRGPKGIEFYDKNGNPWDVKAPPSAKAGKYDFFDSEESGNSILSELRKKGNPNGTFPNELTGNPAPRGVILDSTYLNNKDHKKLWDWLNSNLTAEELGRIVEVKTKI